LHVHIKNVWWGEVGKNAVDQDKVKRQNRETDLKNTGQRASLTFIYKALLEMSMKRPGSKMEKKANDRNRQIYWKN
jgi:hypothetical protein